jgi:Fe-S cluster assembly iron-binding protein IscA
MACSIPAGQREVMMLQLTPAAANHLNILLSTKTGSADAAVRIYRGSTGDLQLRADVPKSDDVGFEHEGRTVLILDKQTSDLLDNCVLDVAQSPQGQTLALKT